MPAAKLVERKDHAVVFKPVISHQQIIADRSLFDTTLKQLQQLLGARLRAPTVALKELDLHLLYKEVTEEGGLARVVQQKLWSKVCAPFQFPASYTSRSFAMKQYYIKFLYDFEQVYFHQYSGPLPVPLTDVVKQDENTQGVQNKRKRKTNPEEPPTASTASVKATEGIKAPNRNGRKRDDSVRPVYARSITKASATPPACVSMPPQPPALTGFHHGQAIQNEQSLVGALVTGHVDSKIDCGYFVSININGYTFQGLLYLPPKPAGKGSGASLPAVMPTPADVPLQTLRPSSPLDDYHYEPDIDDQVHASNMNATECVQAFPIDPTMSTLTEGSVQLIPTSSFEHAEPLPVDPALISPLQQEGTAVTSEDWSRVGSPLHAKPNCSDLAVPDWLAALTLPKTDGPSAGQTTEHSEHCAMHKGPTALSDTTCLHNPNTSTSQPPEHPADPSGVCSGVSKDMAAADGRRSSLRPSQSAEAAQIAHQQHRQLHLPLHPSAIHRVSSSAHEAVKVGQFSREGPIQSSQQLDSGHGLSPPGRAMTGRSPPQQPVSQQQPYSPQLISPSLNISGLMAAGVHQPFISSPYAFRHQ